MPKGFTLIEIILVLAIFSVLSVAGIESITEFQKSALLRGTSDEFAAALRSARTKSINGELLEGEKPEDFSNDGLPIYGVKTDSSSYTLFRCYQLVDQPPNPCPPVLEKDKEDYELSPQLYFFVNNKVIFQRISGSPVCDSSPCQFIVKRKNSSDKSDESKIDITNVGVVKE